MTEQSADKPLDSEESKSQPKTKWPIWVKLPVWILTSVIFGFVALIFIGALIDETDVNNSPSAQVEAPTQTSNTSVQPDSKIVGNWKCIGVDYNGKSYYHDKSFSSSGRYVGYGGEQYTYEVDGDELIVFTEHGKNVSRITRLTNNTLEIRKNVLGKKMGSNCEKA